jgi:hypothetical protein
MKIAFQGNRADVRRLTNRLAGMLSGREPDSLGIGRWYLIAMGFGALSDIKDAFIEKSRGGTDEMGIKWPPLSNSYLAYQRRFGAGEQAKLKKAAGLGAGHRYAPGNNKGLLTAEQLKRWNKLYATYFNRLLLSLPEPLAKTRAAQFAWVDLKKEGAKTKLDVFGNRQVEILRDTGILFNSLSPGVMSRSDPQSSSYQKPSKEGGEDQVFELQAGGVTVGTSVPYAAVHNFGHPSKPKMPKRQFIPEADQIPDSWWERWLGIATKGFDVAAAQLFKRAG